MKGPILALNPNEPRKSIEVVADWCNDHQLDHYGLLYLSSMLAQEGLIFHTCSETMKLLGGALISLPSDRHRFLSVILLLKALISTYRVNIMWISEYSLSSPLFKAGLPGSLALTCRHNGLSPLGLLDVALCRAGTEELINGKAGQDGEAVLNCDLLIEAAEAGKMVGFQLRGQPLEERVGMLLKITGVMCNNILGNCGKAG